MILKRVIYLQGLSQRLSGKKSTLMKEMRVRSLSREDPLEEGMATHSHRQRSLAGYNP